MKKLLLILFVGITLYQTGVAQVIIARNCDPKNNYSPDRFSEIYNVGNTAVDLTGWTLENIQGGKVKFSWSLSGTINPGKTKICGKADTTGQTITPDFTATWSGASWNGKGGDGTILKDNTGTVIDYAVQDDATKTFENKEMKRKLTIVFPTATYDVNQWVFSTVNNANDVIPGFHGTVWRKTTSHTIWETSSNWDDETPTATADVYIPGGVSPHVDNATASPAECNNLTIASGGTLTVPVNKSLTVNGDLSIDASATPGTLTVESGASGNGSLILNGTVTGRATVERYIAAYTPGQDDGWHEIGSPVNNMAISGSDFAPGANDDLYAWGEATNIWLNNKVSGNNITNFTNGNGYLISYQSTATKTFNGTLNNSDISFSNLSYNTTRGNGWHLLGNPFSSAVIWGDANWALSGVSGVAKVWDESGATYVDIAANGIIPSTNGFFVQVTSETNSLTIPVADRTHNTTNNNKNSSVANLKGPLKFKVTNDVNGYYDVNTLGFKAGATEGWDITFDSHKLFSLVKTAPQLWTVSKDQQFSTNYLPEITTTAYNIPLYFRAGVNTVYHLSVTGVNSFENIRLVLEDLQTGRKIDLSQQGNYDFSAMTDDDESRFVLHINSVTAVPSLSEIDGIRVFAYGKTIYLYTPGQKSLKGKVSVFNTVGQEIYTGSLSGMKLQKISLNQKTGIYFVRVEDGNKVVTRKVFIK